MQRPKHGGGRASAGLRNASSGPRNASAGLRSAARALGGAAVAGLLLACGSIANIDRDFEDHPITDTGVAATILMPGEGVAMPNRSPHGGLAPPSAGQPAATANNQNPTPGMPGASSGSGASSGAGAAPSGGGMVMIGGTSQDIEGHRKINNEPAWAKVLKLPFLVAAYPFVKAHQAMTGPPDPTVKITGPPPEAPPSPAELQAQRERRLLEGMEQELARQGSAAGAPPPRAAPPPPGTSHGTAPAPAYGAAPAPATGATSAAPAQRPSIAAELAALRAAMAAPRPAPVPGGAATSDPDPAPRAAPAPPAVERLYESVDRDADGRPDLWIYRTGREVTAEASDDDGDGRAERIVRFAPGTREPLVEEEDTDADGRMDTFTEYEGGQIARRRADTDGDGEIDTWSFYADGQLLRHEQDTDGDGFRDRMTFFEDGRLAREEEDRDGNGEPDRITHFDEHERASWMEEDTNRDGTMDLRSFYREGKLRRRELIR